MSSQNEVNGTKLIKRYNPVLLITCILGLATIGVLLLYCLMPVITLTYTESGVEHKVSVNAFSFINAFFTRMNTGAHTELGDSFFTFLRDQRGTTLNSIQSFMINGCAGRMEQVLVVVLVSLVLLIGFLAIPLGIVCILGIAFGRLHLPGTISGLTLAIYVFLGLVVALLFTFAWLYGDIVTAIVNNHENSVTAGDISPLWMPLIYLIIVVVLHIVISVLTRTGLKNRVFVKRERKSEK